MRIAHLITDLSTGGAEMMLLRLVCNMDRKRFSNHVISLTGIGPVGEQLLSAGVPVTSLGMRKGTLSPTALLHLISWLRARQPDVLQTWLYHSDLLGAMAASVTGIRTVVWNVRCSNMDLVHYSATTRLVVRACAFLSSLPSAVVVNSEAGLRHHSRIGYHPGRWEFIPNGFDLQHYHPDHSNRQRLRKGLSLPEETLLVGSIARFDPMKDHRTLLEAAARLHATYSNVHFVLCGRGVEASNGRLSGWIEELNARGFVHLLGERRDVPEIMSGLDVLASASSFGEGFPSVVGEAMACGAPCVVTDVGDSALVVGPTGRVVPPGDSHAMADALCQLIVMGPDARLRLGLAARERMEQHYSLAAAIRRYQTLYEELVDGSGG